MKHQRQQQPALTSMALSFLGHSTLVRHSPLGSDIYLRLNIRSVWRVEPPRNGWRFVMSGPHLMLMPSSPRSLLMDLRPAPSFLHHQHHRLPSQFGPVIHSQGHQRRVMVLAVALHVDLPERGASQLREVDRLWLATRERLVTGISTDLLGEAIRSQSPGQRASDEEAVCPLYQSLRWHHPTSPIIPPSSLITLPSQKSWKMNRWRFQPKVRRAFSSTRHGRTDRVRGGCFGYRYGPPPSLLPRRPI